MISSDFLAERQYNLKSRVGRTCPNEHPKLFLMEVTSTHTSMTFLRSEDGTELLLKVAERWVKESDKPVIKSSETYIDGKMISQEVEGPVEGKEEFDHIWNEMFRKMNLQEGLAVAAVEMEKEEQSESMELEDDFDHKFTAALKAKAEAVLGKDCSKTHMIKADRTTLRAKMLEEVDRQNKTEPNSEKGFGCMAFLHKLGMKRKTTDGKTSTNKASTKVALELNGVCEEISK